MRRALVILTATVLACIPTAATAQSWVTPQDWSTGVLVTAAMLNQDIRDNTKVLRAGGFAVTSQAIGDLLCASSTTQFARLADVATGQVLVSGGVGACPSYSSTPTFSGANLTGLGGDLSGTLGAAAVGDDSHNHTTTTISALDGADITTGTIANARTTGASLATGDTLVQRDSNGDFAARYITATTFIGALSGNATTATALAADPADCGAGAFATTIAASGALTCGTDGSSLTFDGYTLSLNTTNAAFTFSGAYTLTVPATGTAALLSTANSFSANQTIAKDTPVLFLNDTSGANESSVYLQDNGTLVWAVQSLNSSGTFRLYNQATGAAGLSLDSSSVLTVSGFGTHTFSAGGTGTNGLQVTNTTAGTGNYASVQVGTDVGAGQTALYSFSSTWSSANGQNASGSQLYAAGSGGLFITANNASGAINFAAGGTGLDWKIETDGNLEEGDGTIRITQNGAFVAANGTAGITSLGCSITGVDVQNGIVTSTTCAPSTERVKEHIIRGWHPPTLAAYKALAPIYFDYKAGRPESGGGRKAQVGFSAEEAHATGLPSLVLFDQAGLPSGLQIHSFVAYQHMWLAEVEARLTALEHAQR